jgi:threonine dehydratase
MKIAAARAYGATVDDSPPDIPAAFEHLDRLIEETGRTLVHPYDDPLVMAGQGTVGIEILEDLPDANVVLVPVGGGGLVSGIATAIKGLRPDARVIAVEPELSNALQASMAAGESVTVEPRSFADGLNGPYAGPNCVRVGLELGLENVLVTEEAIADAFRWLYGRLKLACEPAGAATGAALLSGRVELADGDVVAAVVSGGNVAPETAAAILAER